MIKGKIIRGRDTKPPLGIKPKFLHREDRIEQLRMALKSYMDVNIDPPEEWVKEYFELLREKT